MGHGVSHFGLEHIFSGRCGVCSVGEHWCECVLKLVALQ